MPRYTFLTGRNGQQPSMVDGQVETLRDDDDAIAFGKAMLDVEREADQVTVVVGRGTYEDIEWLGAWEREQGQPAVWTKEE